MLRLADLIAVNAAELAEIESVNSGRLLMNTRFLEAFVWAVRLGSFREAAERLNMTQAAISSRIASLEDEFGHKAEHKAACKLMAKKTCGIFKSLHGLCLLFRSAHDTDEDFGVA